MEIESEKMLIHLALTTAEMERKFNARTETLRQKVDLLNSNLNTMMRIVNNLAGEIKYAPNSERKEDNEGDEENLRSEEG